MHHFSSNSAMLFKFGLVLLCSIAFRSVSSAGPKVKMNDGTLLGEYMFTRNGRKFSAFKSIPFAKPPIGELRFKAPVPFDPWQGTRNSTEVHNICPQRDIYRRSEIIEGDEDCLYLNVYTPQLPSSGSDPLPVMVFFHGGGFLCGGGNSLWYGPGILLDRDVVLVVTNYRLGALGFLSTGDEEVPGNNGMKDQSLALKWVQTNIQQFGGDPNSVTIFGESAGGASAQFHMISPLSKGLFHKAIAQSGTAMCTWALAPENEGVAHAHKLAKALNCPTEDTKAMVDCLRKVDAYDIIKQDKIFMDWDLDPMIPFKPVIEKDANGAFLVEHPQDAIAGGRSADVPLVVGLNTDDGALRAAGIFGNPHLIDDINNDFDRVIPISLIYDKTAKNVSAITKKIKHFYFDDKKLTKNSQKELVDLYTDGWFLHCSDKTVRLHKKYAKSPVYLYLFGHRGTSSFTEIFGDPSHDYGVCHADDLQYLFPVGDGLFPDKKPDSDDKHVAEVLTNLWVNFAKTGDPTPEVNELIPNKWEPVQSAKNMEYYFIGTKDTEMRTGLYMDRIEFWRAINVDPHEKRKINDEF